MFAAFIILPTRFWPRNDRELPFLAIALNKMRCYCAVDPIHQTTGSGAGSAISLATGGIDEELADDGGDEQ